MTATTLINAQAISPGNVQLVKTGLAATTTAASLQASITTTIAAFNQQATNLSLWFAVLNDIGTFNAAALEQLKTAANSFNLSIGPNNSDIRWSKAQLFSIDAPQLYTWIEGVGFAASGLTVSLFLREYP